MSFEVQFCRKNTIQNISVALKKKKKEKKVVQKDVYWFLP
jgi:hypothetical protein